jgi:hypothetical protein
MLRAEINHPDTRIYRREILSRRLRHNLQVDLVTASRQSGQRDILVEVVQVGVELAGGGVDGTP